MSHLDPFCGHSLCGRWLKLKQAAISVPWCRYRLGAVRLPSVLRAPTCSFARLAATCGPAVLVLVGAVRTPVASSHYLDSPLGWERLGVAKNILELGHLLASTLVRAVHCIIIGTLHDLDHVAS